MCTLAYWLDDEGRMNILFNRDEARSRPEADEPALHVDRTGCRRLFARDPQGGGTWLAVNSGGTVAALLNDYRNGPVSKPVNELATRGWLPLQFTAFNNFSQLAACRDTLPLVRYNPFKLMVFRRRSPEVIDVGRLTWDGSVKAWSRSQRLFGYETSSSQDPEAVEPHRLRLLQRLKEPRGRYKEWIDGLFGLFNVEDPDNPQQAILMDRPATRTVSQTHVIVDGKSVDFQYSKRRQHIGFDPPHVISSDLCIPAT
ncbi:MAG: NRDE family protein [Oceanipulchritudo sp.]